MQCSKCGSSKVLVEALDNRTHRRVCQACGESTIVAADGKRLLTDDMPNDRDTRRTLTEG